MLHYIPVDELGEENLNRMSGTPHSLGLEVDNPVIEDQVEEEIEVEECAAPIPNVEEEEEEYIDVMDMVEEDYVDENLFSDF